ncbi:hypothetical protein [Ruminococcus sp. MCC718]|uniref:hypothetical protein n=1 Tax=Ruminococcus sp. MCC718 TaxID=2592649 RepID=UPI00207909A1|nr:hypothetical protein [Ruminococcus sp. MCC718]
MDRNEDGRSIDSGKTAVNQEIQEVIAEEKRNEIQRSDTTVQQRTLYRKYFKKCTETILSGF